MQRTPITPEGNLSNRATVKPSGSRGFKSSSASESGSSDIQRTPSGPSTINVLDHEYPTDDYTNIPSSILSRLSEAPVLLKTPAHPLNLLQQQIQRHLSSFTSIWPPPSPVVTSELNFGDLGFDEDHPGRSPTDTYYVNRQVCLRTHTSAHEVETFKKGLDAWLLCADVYRRDEIDASHYPIFHQMEGARVFDPTKGDYDEGGIVLHECEEMEARLREAEIEIDDQVDLQDAGGWQESHNTQHAALALRHLKATLNGLVLELFGPRHAVEAAAAAAAAQGTGKKVNIEPLKVRWVSATFPFTSPSFEIEVLFRGKWLEILGCGVVKQLTLDKAGIPGKLGWAFGLGMERIAMVLYSIPDIRLFWSKDPRFLSQFALGDTRLLEDKAGPIQTDSVRSAGGNDSFSASSASRSKSAELVTFRPYSKYPPCYKDTSFWLPQDTSPENVRSSRAFHENDLMEIVRDTAGDLAEAVELIDDFTHPKTGKRSLCYRVNYRSMDRNLENEEVNELHRRAVKRLVDEIGVTLR
ncbi:phenylalanyl-tRNA synthetase [Tilletiaria anomala UBC 951]|uniref:Phenylalanine--tRNA ligase, mitochondrial n=1 Tax=Tilletiaria anomala (strain ATCC 24038 / CBS 436.72 / UBC 951) TaxID=1037660 RepID=A0A066W8W4_TILAU|nr:phenylalanyl-tRNA synthetase [Tilletiaria anomala UBC 951]KDN50382.1 phenylalanyl-tRNA synthetase [Tilletiaria anomala UBC 951]